MITTTEHFLSMAMFGYVLSCLTFAVVGWFHMCRPHNKTPRYSYPGRPLATTIYAFSLLLVPAILHPSDTDTRVLVNAYFFVLVPYYSGVLLYKYFGSVMQWNGWARPALILLVPIALFIAVLFLYAAVPGFDWLYGPLHYVTLTGVALGAITTLFSIRSIHTVLKWGKLMDDETYSNMDDFPIHYARKIITMPIIHAALLWPPILSGNPRLLAVACLMLIPCNITMLIFKLHPHRVWKEESESLQPKQEKEGNAPPKHTIDNIAKSIRHTVDEEELYLDPHLSMQDVVDRCGYGRTYVSWVFKNRLGGFFNYVNGLRLSYAEQYRKKHPMATLDEVATASGFTTRQSFYRVKQRLTANKPK